MKNSIWSSSKKLKSMSSKKSIKNCQSSPQTNPSPWPSIKNYYSLLAYLFDNVITIFQQQALKNKDEATILFQDLKHLNPYWNIIDCWIWVWKSLKTSLILPIIHRYKFWKTTDRRKVLSNNMLNCVNKLKWFD